MFQVFLMSNIWCSRIVGQCHLEYQKQKEQKGRKGSISNISISCITHNGYTPIEEKQGAKAHHELPTLHNAGSAGRETVESIDAVLSIVDFKANHSLVYSP